MTDWQHEAANRLELYASKREIELQDRLGNGFDGLVVRSSAGTALKALAFERLYLNERNVYLRLMEHKVDEVQGFAVPELIWADDQLWVIEMEIVSAPYVVDFAGAYIDLPPDYPEEVIEQWHADKLEQFGAEQWDIVQTVMAKFGAMGIYLADVKPGNITFAE